MTHSINAIRTVSTQNPVQQSKYTQEITQKISSIEAQEIELIGIKIIERVVNNLGPVGKARVALEMLKKGFPESYMGTSAPILMKLAKRDIKKEQAPFQSDIDMARFMQIALWPVTKKIADSFSTPLSFLEDGLEFQISDNGPMGFVKETAEKFDIEITLEDIPRKYFVTLKVDENLTNYINEKSDLIFVLTEESEGIEFSKRTFTIKELIQESRDQFLKGLIHAKL